MGTVDDILEELRADNDGIDDGQLSIIADAVRVYAEAAENVRRLGGVVVHPRTGAPLENPYLKIQERQGKILAENSHIEFGRVLALCRAQENAHAQNRQPVDPEAPR